MLSLRWYCELIYASTISITVTIIAVCRFVVKPIKGNEEEGEEKTARIKMLQIYLSWGKRGYYDYLWIRTTSSNLLFVYRCLEKKKRSEQNKWEYERKSVN